MLKKNFRKAFTLIELSIILAVVSIILVAMVSIYSSKEKNIKSQQSSDNIKVVYQALQKYLAENRALPCPASLKSIKSSSSDYGVAVSAENCVGVGVYQSNSVSTLVYGMVPTATLGLDNKFAEDAYGNKLVYVTDYRLTSASTFGTSIKNSALISISGGVSVSNAIFVVMSRGTNSSGAFPANSSTMLISTTNSEQSNDITNLVDNTPPTPSTANFTGSFTQSNSSSDFDDVVFYKTADQALSENSIGSNLTPCESSDSTESLYGTFITWPKAYPDQIVAANTACPSPNWIGSVAYPTKKCGSNGVWSSVINNCSCSGGYSGPSCEVIELPCSFSGVTGIPNGTTVNQGTRDINCSGEYQGTINYTCNSNQTITINSGSCSLLPYCDGGTVTDATISGTNYKVHTFTSSSTLSCSTAKVLDILIVGGGGGGGREMAGGGGGGGVVLLSSVNSGVNLISVTVGAGAVEETDPFSRGKNGNPSSITINSTTYTAIGGGGGAGANSASSGASGASGGGGSSGIGGVGQYETDSDPSTFGNAGGTSGGCGSSGASCGGGGGGAGSAGSNGTSSGGGKGGDGYLSNITGTNTYYGGGGGGSSQNEVLYGLGGQGGGGRGSHSIYPYQYPVAGTNGLGGGGGGCGRSIYCSHGAAGGSGVVIVRYPYNN